jgi:hypothetical protein
MDRVGWTTREGKQILLVDFTDCTPEGIIETTSEATSFVTAQPRNSVLALVDFAGAQFSREAITRLKEVAVFNRPYVKRSAWVGTQKLPKVFFDAIETFSRREFERFETREQAMEFLARD